MESADSQLTAYILSDMRAAPRFGGRQDVGSETVRLNDILDRILLGGYEAAKEDATRRIIARYARGNVNVQNGHLLNEHDLKKRCDAGDKAMKKLQAWANANKS